MQEKDFHGICFINLVDFDMLYGHRRDVDGYALALNEFDQFLPKFLAKLGEEDIVMITADHGCDPAYTATTDHTREYVPLLAAGKKSDLQTWEFETAFTILQQRLPICCKLITAHPAKALPGRFYKNKIITAGEKYEIIIEFNWYFCNTGVSVCTFLEPETNSVEDRAQRNDCPVFNCNSAG